MGFIRKMVDKAADIVQGFSGEKERREQVNSFKQLKEDFTKKLKCAIASLNRVIDSFNQEIQQLNKARESEILNNITRLNCFLSKFGNCKDTGDYVREQEKLPAEFPSKPLIIEEDYLNSIDWTTEEVFIKSLINGPIFTKLKTRKINLEMKEKYNEASLAANAILTECATREYSTDLEREVCRIYKETVQFISSYISTKIIPELELVEAFLQAESLKDIIISDQEEQLMDRSLSYNIQVVENTIYEKHFLFVQNAFLFYILACRIYNTPVLTRLLNNNITDIDKEQVEKERILLDEQVKKLDNKMSIRRE